MVVQDTESATFIRTSPESAKRARVQGRCERVPSSQASEIQRTQFGEVSAHQLLRRIIADMPNRSDCSIQCVRVVAMPLGAGCFAAGFARLLEERRDPVC